ncbi:MAG: NosD domain-containing protein [Gemmatimonadaceae bacterium]
MSAAEEKPILIGYAQVRDVYSYTDDGVPMERKPLRPGEVWIDYDAIPATPPTPSAWPGTAAEYTTGVLNEPLVATADPLRFTTSPSSRLSRVLPGNMRSAAYRAQLRDAAGSEIPYDPSVWVVDGTELVVAFKTTPPSPPLSLTYWVYTGDIAGASPIAAVANEGGGTGVVYDATVDRVVRLRTIEGDANGITVATTADTVRISNAITGGNLGAGAGIFAQKNGASLELRSIVGVEGVTATQTATEVTLSNTLTGANIGAGTGTVFASKSGNTLQFNSLAGNSNGVTVAAPVNGTIVLSNTVTGLNSGAGAGIYISKVGNALQFNTLTGSSGIAVSSTATQVIIDNLVTGANVGLGTGQIFSDKSGNLLRFRGLNATATSGMTISTVSTTVDVKITIATWFVSDQKPTGTAGGDSTSLTLHTRTLNTITSNGSGTESVTLASDQITFAAGRYWVYGTVANRAGDGVAASLYDGAGAIAISGQSAFNSGAAATTPCAFAGIVTAAGSYTVRQYITTGRAVDGLGAAASIPGQNEVYTMVTIIRLADF